MKVWNVFTEQGWSIYHKIIDFDWVVWDCTIVQRGSLFFFEAQNSQTQQYIKILKSQT